MRLNRILVAAALIGGTLAPPTAMGRTTAPTPAELTEAVAACRASDFTGLFEAYLRSRAVSQTYSASEVTVEDLAAGTSEKVGHEDYAPPIALVDSYWVTRAYAERVAAGVGGEPEYVELQFNQGQNEAWAVEWQQVVYDGNSSGGDDLGEVIERVGQPGKLLFMAKDDCWQLVSETRYAE